jgi:eukaryotic-like serine/threonine-protein kinase
MVEGLRAGDPQHLGPYRLLGRLGDGGMGQVFLGRSAGGRLVAVKVIRPELAGDAGFRARFAHEVSAARHVSGLFTALVVDADTQGPVPWLATAYVAGPSLAEAVDVQGPLPVASVLTLAAGLTEGLAAIHAAGVVHRDLKPSNVLLAGDGPRVIDFGISRAAEASVLTQTGMVMGSPGFMSPEQAEGGEVGPPSDVFSLGAVLVFAATGVGPFGTGSTPALIYRVVHQQPDTTPLPEPIRPLIERCLAKDPSQRPATADLLAELGNAQPAQDWLPAPLTEALGHYVPPATGGTGAPPTMTSAKARRTPTEAVFGAQPTDTDGQPQRKNRPGPAWALLGVGVLAALVAAAIAVPMTIGGSPVSHSARGTGASSTHNSASSRRSPTSRAASHAGTPAAVPQPSPVTPPPSGQVPSGPPPTLTAQQLVEVAQALKKGPRANGFSTKKWTLAQVEEVIERITGIRYSQLQTRGILRKRLRWKRPPPVVTSHPAVTSAPATSRPQSATSPPAVTSSPPPVTSPPVTSPPPVTSSPPVTSPPQPTPSS